METHSVVLKAKVDPKEIAREFIIGELIKMFPKGDIEFHDKIRFFVRETMDSYPENRFWNLIAGMSENFMVKSLHRILRGDQFIWSLEEVPTDKLYVTMLHHPRLDEILPKVDHNVKKAADILSEIDPEERFTFLAPLKLDKDYLPVIAHEENGRLEIHDGSRRTLNLAIYGFPRIKAYVGKLNPKGKPAIDEGFFTTLTKIIKDEKHVDTGLVESITEILLKAKNNYANGQKLSEQYAKENIYPLLKRAEYKRIIERVFEDSLPDHALDITTKVNGIQPKKRPQLYVKKYERSRAYEVME